MNESPPLEFDTGFFDWLDRVSTRLLIDFASTKAPTEPDISLRVEQQLGFQLPEDIRRFYKRFSVWGVRIPWIGWGQTELQIRQGLPINVPLVPIDLRSYSSTGVDVVATVESPIQYTIIGFVRSTHEIRKYENLRTYFICQVNDEIRFTN
jgi:hypothetical protein